MKVLKFGGTSVGTVERIQHVAKIIKIKKPKIVLLENVANFAKHDHGKTLNTVKKVLTDLSYNFFLKQQ